MTKSMHPVVFHWSYTKMKLILCAVVVILFGNVKVCPSWIHFFLNSLEFFYRRQTINQRVKITQLLTHQKRLMKMVRIQWDKCFRHHIIALTIPITVFILLSSVYLNDCEVLPYLNSAKNAFFTLEPTS